MSDHRTGSLGARSLAAVTWSALDIGGRQLLQFGATVILARLLSPAEFGLIGMLMLFVAVAQSFIDSGFGSALIQRKVITEAEQSSVFFFNVASGGTATLLLFLMAPHLASFYRQPILEPITKALSFNLLIDSVTSLQLTLLRRDMDFRTLCKIGLVTTAISGVVAVWMAWRGFGVWSLVLQSLVANSLSAILLWMWRPWRPSTGLSVAALRSLFGFGSRLLMAGLLNTIFERVQFLIIGKVFSPAALGYYTRAYSTQQLPVGLLSTIVSRVTFPVFSSISEDRDALYRGVRKALVSLAMLTFPLMLGICVAAKPLVVTIFGAKWLPCVSCLQVLCLAGLFWPLHIMNLNLLMAMGRSDLFFRLEVIKKVLITIALGVTFSISVIAMVWGGLAVSVACYFLNAYYPGRLIEYGAVKQLRDVAPCAAVSLGMGGCAWAVGRFFTAPPAALIAEVIVGVLVYWSLCAWLRLEIYMVVLDQAQRAIATKLSALLPPWTPGSRSRT